MPRANTVQTNFTSGEISPLMYGRVDVAKYFNGARKLRGMISLPQGGAIRLPGTEYLGSVHDKTKNVRVRTFSFSETDSYVLEFGHLTLRIWKTGATVGAPLVVVTPYDHTTLSSLRLAQSGDKIFVAHPDYYPRVITRVDNANWTIDLYDNVDGPYLSSDPGVSVTLSGVTDRATATALASLFVTSGGTKNITALTTNSRNEIVLTSNAHGFADGDSVLIKAVGGVPEALGAWRISVTANTFTLRGSRKRGTSAYTSGGTAIAINGTHAEYRENGKYKLAHIIDVTSATVATVDVVDDIVYQDPPIHVTEYPNTAVAAVQMVASAPFFHTGQRDSVIRPDLRQPGLGWSWGLLSTLIDSKTYDCVALSVQNFDDPTKEVTISGRTITGTLTAASATFAASDVGRQFRLNYGQEWVPGTITGYTSTTVVTVELDRDVPTDPGAAYDPYGGGKTDIWKFGAWTSTTGYPRAVAFHQNRLCWAATDREPSTVWMTVSGDYYTFQPSDPESSAVGDDDAITITIVSRQVNVIRWMDSGPVLLIGTEGAEWQVKPSSIQQTITPTNISATLQTACGSMDMDVIRVGSRTLFVERSALKMREMVYDFSIDSFMSKDLSIMSEHILREHGGAVDWCLQQNPYNIIWIVLGDGMLASVTYEPEHEVVAWTLHDVGGEVESCTCVSATDGEDEIYLVVGRTINAVAQKYVERITGLLDPAGYCHCSKNPATTPPPAATGVITGLNHLNGETVQVVIDGTYIGEFLVAGNQIDIGGYGVTALHLGLATESVIGILDPEGGSPAGTSQAKKKRISESSARVFDSWYFKTASATGTTNDTENLTASQDPEAGDRTRIVPALTIPAPVSGEPIDAGYAPVSGDIAFAIDDAFDNGGRFEIVQDEPYPMNVVALHHVLNTME